MAATPNLRFETANRVDLNIAKANEIASFHFQVPGSTPLVVTIPLAECRRFFQRIARKLDQEPMLFERESRRDRS